MLNEVWIMWENGKEVIKERVAIIGITPKTYQLKENKLGRKSVTKNMLNRLSTRNIARGEGLSVVAEDEETAIEMFYKYLIEEKNKLENMLSQL